jgi:sugar phosphate isomerase/epimerase
MKENGFQDKPRQEVFMNRNSTGCSRRDFLKAGGAAALLAAGGCSMTSSKRTAPQPLSLGLQLYAVRDACAEDLAGTVKRVGTLGFKGVEFAGYYGWNAPDLRKLLDDSGLKCCGAHIGFDTLLGDELERTVDFHKTLGNRFLIVPGLPEERRNSKAAWLKTAAVFNEIAAKLEPHGMFCGYHNHTVEFQPLEGELPWDLFFGNTRRDVVMQVDTGNAMTGGADPVALLRRYPGRAKTVHAKPYARNDPAACIGEDEVPWKEVLSLCRTTAGTQWLIVEQEQFRGTSLDGVHQSLEGLKALLA